MEPHEISKKIRSANDSIGYILSVSLENITDDIIKAIGLNYSHIELLESMGVFDNISFQELQKLRSAKRKAKDILGIS